MSLGVMWRRTVWDKIGGFAPCCDFAEDFDYWIRASIHFKLIKCHAPILYFRYHDKQMSIRRESAQLAAHELALVRYWVRVLPSKPFSVTVWLKIPGHFLKYFGRKMMSLWPAA